MVHCTCVRSAMLYGSETWCLRESEMAILRRSLRAMVRSMCGVMANVNGVRCYGHVIRKYDDNILKKAMMLEVNGKQ